MIWEVSGLEDGVRVAGAKQDQPGNVINNFVCSLKEFVLELWLIYEKRLHVGMCTQLKFLFRVLCFHSRVPAPDQLAVGCLHQLFCRQAKMPRVQVQTIPFHLFPGA